MNYRIFILITPSQNSLLSYSLPVSLASGAVCTITLDSVLTSQLFATPLATSTTFVNPGQSSGVRTSLRHRFCYTLAYILFLPLQVILLPFCLIMNLSIPFPCRCHHHLTHDKPVKTLPLPLPLHLPHDKVR